MKLTYWYAECLDDADCYSIRTRTKREAVKLRAGYDVEPVNPERFGPVIKVFVEYRDGFDLLGKCTDEGKMWWESSAD